LGKKRIATTLGRLRSQGSLERPLRDSSRYKPKNLAISRANFRGLDKTQKLILAPS